jgi:tripartite-type tricarboxylate transporter receptor subunit TctC
MRSVPTAALVLVAATALLSSAYAQTRPADSGQAYPMKPIRLLVPFGPGGVGDITSRAVAQKMTEAMGQQIIIDNRPSAGGIVAMELVAKAEPDGYTLMLLNNTNAVSAAMFRKLPYDTVKDFAMVSTIGAFTIVVLASPDSPVKTLRDLVTQARATPGKLNTGTTDGMRKLVINEIAKWNALIDKAKIPRL